MRKRLKREKWLFVQKNKSELSKARIFRACAQLSRSVSQRRPKRNPSNVRTNNYLGEKRSCG